MSMPRDGKYTRVGGTTVTLWMVRKKIVEGSVEEIRDMTSFITLYSALLSFYLKRLDIISFFFFFNICFKIHIEIYYNFLLQLLSEIGIYTFKGRVV